MASVFVNANQARKDSRNASVIHGEVRSLESTILTSISQGVLSIVVNSGTTMTDDANYYSAYYLITNDTAKADQVEYVSKYFTDLGYSVNITENPNTNNSLVWNIGW